MQKKYPNPEAERKAKVILQNQINWFVSRPNFSLHSFVEEFGLENLEARTRRILHWDAVNWIAGYRAVVETIPAESIQEWHDAILGLKESVLVCKKFIADCETLEQAMNRVKFKRS